MLRDDGDMPALDPFFEFLIIAEMQKGYCRKDGRHAFCQGHNVRGSALPGHDTTAVWHNNSPFSAGDPYKAQKRGQPDPGRLFDQLGQGIIRGDRIDAAKDGQLAPSASPR